MQAMLSKRIVYTVMTAAFFLFAVTGCTRTVPDPPELCTIPNTHLVEKAFSTAKATLSQAECQYQFEEIWEKLLTISQGDPSLENKKHFSEFLVFARDNGLINTVQAEEYYTRYFSHNFISLPKAYQTCSYCKQVTSITSQCKKELQEKEMGLSKICNDRGSYKQAWGDYKDLKLILEATCMACVE